MSNTVNMEVDDEQEEYERLLMRPRTPRRREGPNLSFENFLNTATRRRRLGEPRVVEDNNDADTAARRAVVGPDAYRVFRGWQLHREAMLWHRVHLLTQQPEVIAQIYGIDPARTDRGRMQFLGQQIQRELHEDGFPPEAIRRLRDIAPDSRHTRVFDRYERVEPMELGPQFGPYPPIPIYDYAHLDWEYL